MAAHSRGACSTISGVFHMIYHLVYDPSDSSFIIMNEEGYYVWVYFIQVPSHLSRFPDTGFTSIDDWIKVVTKGHIRYLGSFTKDTFSEWCAQRPEYLI